jgi:hypothetical protein
MKVRLTYALLTRAHNIFLHNDNLTAGLLFSRPELRALYHKGYLKRRMARYNTSTLFWVYSGTPKLFTKEAT